MGEIGYQEEIIYTFRSFCIDPWTKLAVARHKRQEAKDRIIVAEH